jgi:hypothetical protein
MRSLFFISLPFFFLSCKHQPQFFRSLTTQQTGISFNNQITEKPGLSVLNYEYIYNGGGVGIGDFNNDSLPDIFFSGNMVSCKLYLNKGNMRFADVTDAAGAGGEGKWCKGVSVVDINNDGLMDIYISAGALPSATSKKNILYINEGVDKTSGFRTLKMKRKSMAWTIAPTHRWRPFLIMIMTAISMFTSL